MPGSSQNCFDARKHFANIEGLGYVVIGADFETDDAIDV
jgi:hypothetical protein